MRRLQASMRERQCRFSIASDCQVHLVVAGEILIVGPLEQFLAGNADHLGAVFRKALRLIHPDPVERRDAMRQHVHVFDFETQYHVRGTDIAGAVKRMIRRKVHAVALIVDRRLQRFRKFHEQLDCVWRSRQAAAYDHRIFRGYEEPGSFGDGA